MMFRVSSISVYQCWTLWRIKQGTKMESLQYFSPPPPSEEAHSWVDSLPFEIPFGLATTFKSDEDWLDDWEEVSQVVKKPYTFDDRVDDYR